MQKFCEVRDILVANKIKYVYRVVNQHNANFFGSTCVRSGTFGEKTDCSHLYYIYVHKKDYHNACAVLHNLNLSLM
jgi:hypothetical protein